MSATRVILEMGIGNDLEGEDYTKAALRAIDDAMHHSSLGLFRSLAIDPERMEIEATIGVAQPERVDTRRLRSAFPYGRVLLRVIKGGLNVPDEDGGGTVIANAAIAVRIELPQHPRA